MPATKKSAPSAPPRRAQLKIQFHGCKAWPTRGTWVVPLTARPQKGKKLQGFLADLEAASAGALSAHMAVQDFYASSAKNGDAGENSGGSKMCEIFLASPKLPPRIVLLDVGAAAELDAAACERLGARVLAQAKKTAEPLQLWLGELHSSALADAELAARAALGAQLAHYRFTRYKTKASHAPDWQLSALHVHSAAQAQSAFVRFAALAEGVGFARDLVNEPANVLSPPVFAQKVRAALKPLGVQVSLFGEKPMRSLKMRALLGVGQGSAQESHMVVMRWRGAGARNKKPLVFVGKGVCFDTGGISLKPPGGMEDMKGDMGGAAAVSGLIYALARRKAPVDAIGLIGLVENMPDGKAQRPGDIVTSMSGQTIEILNTDAEGRLVLADLLWYAQKTYRPALMIDLATLTGAIIIALGQEYAGLFSNNDELAERLVAAGKSENEPVWRMPLCKNFDKMMDSKNADMKNIGGGRSAGSATAAQFLQRFTNKVPWAHLDIAGVAMGAPQTATNKSWGSGFGVKLLDGFVRDYYEPK